MNASSIAVSTLGTLAVVGYLCYTEFPFWERWTKKDEASSSSSSSSSGKPRLVKRKKKPKKNKRKKSASSTSASAAATPEVKKTYRTGEGVYWVDKICDCQQSNAILLETVEFTSNSTILHFLNAFQKDVSAYPPGHDNQQYILEWSYDQKGDRPRHDIKELREIPEFPSKDKPLNFQLVFPRVSDEAPKFQLTGRASTKLDYFMVTAIDTEQKMSDEEAENYAGFRRCGFNGVERLASDQEKRFSAHKHPSSAGFRWSTSPELEISGSSRKDAISVRGVSEGEGEVCLKARVDGESCQYCQKVKVTDENNQVAADFKMTTCSGLPSRGTNWQFQVTKPKRGAAYSWEVSPGRIGRLTHKKPTLIMTPNLRPGPFEVTLHTTSKSGKSTTTRKYHSVYSCVTPF